MNQLSNVAESEGRHAELFGLKPLKYYMNSNDIEQKLRGEAKRSKFELLVDAVKEVVMARKKSKVNPNAIRDIHQGPLESVESYIKRFYDAVHESEIVLSKEITGILSPEDPLPKDNQKYLRTELFYIYKQGLQDRIKSRFPALQVEQMCLDNAMNQAISIEAENKRLLDCRQRSINKPRFNVNQVVVRDSQARETEEKDQICHNCGVKGHLKKQCKKPPALCFYCNKKGHLIRYCVNKQQSRGKRIGQRISKEFITITTLFCIIFLMNPVNADEPRFVADFFKVTNEKVGCHIGNEISWSLPEIEYNIGETKYGEYWVVWNQYVCTKRKSNSLPKDIQTEFYSLWEKKKNYFNSIEKVAEEENKLKEIYNEKFKLVLKANNQVVAIREEDEVTDDEAEIEMAIKANLEQEQREAMNLDEIMKYKSTEMINAERSEADLDLNSFNTIRTSINRAKILREYSKERVTNENDVEQKVKDKVSNLIDKAEEGDLQGTVKESMDIMKLIPGMDVISVAGIFITSILGMYFEKDIAKRILNKVIGTIGEHFIGRIGNRNRSSITLPRRRERMDELKSFTVDRKERERNSLDLESNNSSVDNFKLSKTKNNP
uniref:CCHC-type domain-containing protein n=1 Tax=Strongyloides stercoralis TaxID=6248 RepID=A0A0K0ER72_STRER